MGKVSKNKIIKMRRLGLLLAPIILTGIWLYFGNTTIKVREIVVEDPSIPKEFDNYKIAHVSDLHNHYWKGQLIEKIQKSNPDIIVITGDLIDSRRPDEYRALDFINQGLEIAPIFYVTGNHEGRHLNYLKFKGDMETLGARVLDDEFVYLEKNNSKIKLVGLNDPYFTRKTEEIVTNNDIVEYHLDQLEDNFDGYKILLSHRPELFSSYKNKKIDLTLSGHAHGGQFRIPIIGGIFAPGQGIFPKYTSGLYEEDGYKLIVSRGLGNSMIPVRVNNNPELIIVNLKSEKQ